MAFSKHIIGGPISINGQTLKLHNNSPGNNAHASYNVSSMYGKPVLALWVGDKVQFTTDKKRAFRTDGNSLSEYK